jgi:hypothetical protein
MNSRHPQQNISVESGIISFNSFTKNNKNNIVTHACVPVKHANVNKQNDCQLFYDSNIQ